MTNLHNGVITESPFELNRPDAGDYLFAIAAKDASNIEGYPVRYLISLPDPRTKNSIYSSDEALRDAGFPGEKISCNTHDRNLYPDTTTGPWFATWEDGIVWHSGNTVASFTYWTGNSDITDPVTTNSKLLAIDLGTTITVSPNMFINSTGIDTPITVTWYYLNDEETGAVWQNTTDEVNIRARWIKAKIECTVDDGVTAIVNEISIELTGDLVQETLEGINMTTLRASGDFDHLFPDSVDGHMLLPYTRPFEAITHISISVVAAGAATSYEIIQKNLASDATTPGPEVQLYKWITDDFIKTDLVFDAYIRGI
jgi:hypothetical protein